MVDNLLSPHLWYENKMSLAIALLQVIALLDTASVPGGMLSA